MVTEFSVVPVLPVWNDPQQGGHMLTSQLKER